MAAPSDFDNFGTSPHYKPDRNVVLQDWDPMHGDPKKLGQQPFPVEPFDNFHTDHIHKPANGQQQDSDQDDRSRRGRDFSSSSRSPSGATGARSLSRSRAPEQETLSAGSSATRAVSPSRAMGARSGSIEGRFQQASDQDRMSRGTGIGSDDQDERGRSSKQGDENPHVTGLRSKSRTRAVQD